MALLAPLLGPSLPTTFSVSATVAHEYDDTRTRLRELTVPTPLPPPYSIGEAPASPPPSSSSTTTLVSLLSRKRAHPRLLFPRDLADAVLLDSGDDIVAPPRGEAAWGSNIGSETWSLSSVFARRGKWLERRERQAGGAREVGHGEPPQFVAAVDASNAQTTTTATTTTSGDDHTYVSRSSRPHEPRSRDSHSHDSSSQFRHHRSSTHHHRSSGSSSNHTSSRSYSDRRRHHDNSRSTRPR
ncbi:uncharacterized protein V1518DRAFT_420161 [Limtongia smithiae]|uniref:uncharacterized protein n=1 Tax=Limtongia smithiae TaxID=1125753 RepID=UPI0034CE9601